MYIFLHRPEFIKAPDLSKLKDCYFGFTYISALQAVRVRGVVCCDDGIRLDLAGSNTYELGNFQSPISLVFIDVFFTFLRVVNIEVFRRTQRVKFMLTTAYLCHIKKKQHKREGKRDKEKPRFSYQILN